MLPWGCSKLLAIHISMYWPKPLGKGGRELAEIVKAQFPCYRSHSKVTKHGCGGEIIRKELLKNMYTLEDYNLAVIEFQS